jgi:hypothetical protein
MGRFTITKINHFQTEYLPFLNSIKRKPRVKVEVTDTEQLKKKVTRALESSELYINPEKVAEKIVKLKEEQDLLIKDSIIRK